MADVVYRSEIDERFVTVARVTTGAAFVALLVVFYLGFSVTSLLVIPLLIAGAALPWWIMMSTTYTLTNRTLEIRSGPFSWTVVLGEITRIQATKNSSSSPALSLDRLRIQHHAGAQVMISPENRRDFLEELRRRGVTVEIGR